MHICNLRLQYTMYAIHTNTHGHAKQMSMYRVVHHRMEYKYNLCYFFTRIFDLLEQDSKLCYECSLLYTGLNGTAL